MATVTGLTAQRMQEIVDATIVGGEVVGGELILETFDGTLINLGQVQGEQGIQGIQGPPGADASFGGYEEPLNDLGNVAGVVNINFATHNVWRINPTAAVTINFQNLPAAANIQPGTLIVANSSFAITWPAGTKFPNALPPVINGETWLSMVARSTHVTVGRAWAAVA